jgi:hypothetical protein
MPVSADPREREKVTLSSHNPSGNRTPAGPGPRPPWPRRPAALGRRPRLAAAAGLAGTAGLAVLLSMLVLPAASARAQAGILRARLTARAGPAAVRLYCAAVPSKCGYPDGTNTGLPGGITLRVVPGQVSSGPGWHYDALLHYVRVNGKGAVLSALYIPCNVDITAPGVTIKDSHIVTVGTFGISLRHAAGSVIENSTISGRGPTLGRLDAGIMDLYGDSAGLVIKNNNIQYARTALLVDTGTISGNYIHAFGYMRGDHTNGIFDPGSTSSLLIYDNTILDGNGQTDAITLDASAPGHPVANKIVEDNLLAGGSYTLYAGDSLNNVTSHIVIEDNRFSTVFYPKSGQYGPAAYFGSQGRGNAWSGNIWDSSGQVIPPP